MTLKTDSLLESYVWTTSLKFLQVEGGTWKVQIEAHIQPAALLTTDCII